jgi:hypothetical protein
MFESDSLLNAWEHGAGLDGSMDELMDELMVTAPGPRLCAVLEGLEDHLATDHQKEQFLVLWERQLAWTHARRSGSMVAAASSQAEVPSFVGGMDDFGPDVVALLLGTSTGSARREVGTARALAGDLPLCAAALERGDISWRMAQELVAQVAHLDVEQRALVDDRMLPEGPVSRDVSSWRRRVRREVLRVDADAEERRKRAVAHRKVQWWPAPDGQAVVSAELSAEGAAVVMAGLTALADRCDPQDPRTMDQRRADALVGVFHDVLSDPDLPKRQGERARIAATGGVLTLLGLRNDPGELVGYGPITAEHLREIAADGDWYRFTTAPDTGHLIAMGSATYRPKAVLRRFLLAAEPTCDFPGCAVAASRCDCEHTVEHDRGGPTDPHNTRPRCRRHHRCKTHAGWHVERGPDGSTTWTTPAGSRSTAPPYRLAGDVLDEWLPERSTDPPDDREPVGACAIADEIGEPPF